MAVGLRDYELVVIFRPDIPDDDVPASVERVQQSIASRGGEVVEVDHWGRRRLAYPIKQALEGNYVVTQMRMDPNQVAQFESGLRISEDVLRHLVMRKDE